MNLLLGKNLGKICGSIPAIFWAPGLLFPGENLGEVRSRNRTEILAAGMFASRRDFGHQDFCFPARILVKFVAGSRRDFGCRKFRFLVRILPGSLRDSRREEKSWQPKSCQDPDGIPAEIAAGSRQDPGTYFTRECHESGVAKMILPWVKFILS